ncbi:MAG: hypothetical protein C0608_01470 [Deltaproteobacteria bacterium]|nr:MAG: hypothetical protein C0608_01470 [Deltaproteobacteria bacterium]
MIKAAPIIKKHLTLSLKYPISKLMARPLAAVLFLITILPLFSIAYAGFSSSTMALVPKQELLSRINVGEAKGAEKLIKEHSFDGELLGLALHKTIKCGEFTSKERLGLMRMLLVEGADIEYRDPSGATPLITSAKEGLAGVGAFLLEKGAERDARDNSSKSALDHAKERHGEDSAVALALTPAKQGNVPIVDNITLMMKKGHVYITYDLSGTEKACISLSGSMDGGKSYGMKFDHVAGDIGRDIKAKRGNLIIWKMKADYPEGLGGSEIIMDVVANKCR